MALRKCACGPAAAVVAMVLVSVQVPTVSAAPVQMNGAWVEVDYWAGSGPNQAILVIDWNTVNGPYASESHAWGYRWSGAGSVKDAVSAIDAAGPLTVTTGYGGGFVMDAFYNNPAVDSDNHSSTGRTGWWWAGHSANGSTWVGNGGGIDTEPLVNQGFYGLNLDPAGWTGDSLTVPAPEPATLGLLAIGAAGLLRRRGEYRRA